MKHLQTQNSVNILLIISLSLIGVSYLLGGGSNNVHAFFNFYHLAESLPSVWQSVIAGLAFIVTAALVTLSIYQAKMAKIAFLALLILAIFPLLTLLSDSRWVTELGGFPIIGSGQGIIKYVALISLGFYLYRPQQLSKQALALINLFPVALVLIWIGAMKFYAFEAKGIESLVSTSPFMSWLYSLFSLQTASNIIGGYDIFFAGTLALAVIYKHKYATYLAALGCAAVFIMTQTFLISAQGAFNSSTLLAGLGIFVIKDLWFIANLAVVIHAVTEQQ